MNHGNPDEPVRWPERQVELGREVADGIWNISVGLIYLALAVVVAVIGLNLGPIIQWLAHG